MNRKACAWAIGMACMAAAGVTRAEAPHPPLELHLAPSLGACVGRDVEIVARVVVVELHAELVVGPRFDATRVDVACEGDQALIRVNDPLTGKIVERRVQLAHQPVAGRARLLGLAIVETVAASWVELEMVSTPALRGSAGPVAHEAARSGAAAVAQARLIDRRVPTGMLSLAAVLRLLADDELLTLGARLDGEWRLGARFVLGLDLSGEQGRTSLEGGQVTISMVSMAPRLGAHVHGLGFDLKPSVGFRLGIAELRGESGMAGVQGRSFVAPWGGPTAGVEGHTTIAGGVGVAVGLEAGLVTLAVKGQVDGADAASVDGGWGAAWVSLSYTP